MKKVLKFIGLLIIVYVVVFSCNTIITYQLKNKISDDLKEINETSIALDDIRNTVQYFRDKVPIPQPGGITLYNVVLNENLKRVVYYYRNDDALKSELSLSEINNYKNEWRKNSIITMRNNPYNKSFVETKMTIIYILEDKTKVKILEFSISPKEYE